MVSRTKIRHYEAYWQAYFDELDGRQPIPNDVIAAKYFDCRKITSYSCPDGVLFSFEPGDQLEFIHRSTTRRIFSLLDGLVAPIELGLQGPYDVPFDVGPLHLARAPAPGQTVTPPVYIHRIHLSGGLASRLTPEVACEQVAKAMGKDSGMQLQGGYIPDKDGEKPN